VKLGTENKKAVYWLAGLGVVLAGLLYMNYSDSSSTPHVATKSAAPGASDVTQSEESNAPRPRGRVDEFLPALHKKNTDKNGPQLPKDPTLRLDLIAKLDEVPAAGGGRDLFNFGKPPAPVTLAGSEPVVKPQAPWVPIGPRYTPPPKPIPPPPPPAPPPINLKYYGILTTRADGTKIAFFMDGEDILIGPEGQTFKGRYRLLRIGVNSAVVEDLQHKHEQTLPLAEDAIPGSGD
jgi:hypothetical protein